MLDPKFAAKVSESETLQDVLKYSSQLEGTIKSYGRHACTQYDSIITVNGKQMKIGEAYSLYGSKGTVVDIRTPYGDKKAIVVLGSYSKVYRLDCLDDNGLIITSLNLSANHEVLIGDIYSPKFTEYKKIVEDQQFRFSASFNENTDYVDDFFISGFLLQHLKFDPLKGMVYPVPTGFNFGNYYNLGREAFIRNWGSVIDAGTLFLKIRDICRLYVHTNGSILKYRSYDDNDGFMGYDKLFSETNFLNGLFSSLVTFGSNTEGGIKRKYGYFHRHSDITKLGEIKDEINDHLQKFNFQLSDDLFLTDESFVKWTAANFYLSVNRDIVDQGEVFPGTPFISFAKGGKVSEKKEQLYDVQILSNDSKYQCYYANSIVIHNCGIVLSPVNLNESIPLYSDNGLPVTQYDGGTVEKLGFIKVDLLGVKVLSIIDESLKYINLNPKYNKISSVYEFPLDDTKTYDLLSSGETLGVFQLEGASVSPSVPLVKPDSIHDIAAMLGVWRPGPMGMSYDKMYIERKHNPDSSRDFYIPRYNHIFIKTYGLGIYQEQYMILLQEMCGFDPIKTDVWRKGVGRTVDFYSFL